MMVIHNSRTLEEAPSKYREEGKDGGQCGGGDHMGVPNLGELKQSILSSSSGKRVLTFRPGHGSWRANDWPLSDVPSDLIVEVGSTSFPLHKFPLVAKSRKIRSMFSGAKDTKPSKINLQSIPGGREAFELAAKFCYGISIDITLKNVAMLHCAAYYLQMTEELSEKNLEHRTEIFLKEMVMSNITNSIAVLHHCESLLPTAEEINLVGRIIAAIASNVCKEQLASGLSRLENLPVRSPTVDAEPPSDWWGKSLAVLNPDFFQRVLSIMKSKGLKQDTVSKILMNYAQNSLYNLPSRDFQKEKGGLLDAEVQMKRRQFIEMVVTLLPTQSRKSPVPISFLSGLLKMAIASSTSIICKTDLEKRIALQLDQAILEDILIPAKPHGNFHQQMYNTESVLQIFSTFLRLEQEDMTQLREDQDIDYEFDSSGTAKRTSILKVSKLMDSYLSEIALDSNLMPTRFMTLAELLPDYARLVDDGLYRAVDIFLKVHPNIKDSERYHLCKTINCQKLSPEACSHAAQNERLPVQMAVQVLYFEQIRLRNAMNGAHDHFFTANGQCPQRLGSGVGSGAMSPRDNYASVRRENRELKLEVARMRIRLTDLEKDHVSMKNQLVCSNPANNTLKSFTKKLRQLTSLIWLRDRKPINAKNNPEARFLFQKQR